MLNYGVLRLTKRSEYGLMALAYMAQSGDAYTSVKSIVSDLGVPRRLLAEVLKELSRANLVEAVRGPGGGYRLTQPPEDLSLARVVEILEGPVKVAECTDGGRCDLSPSCTIQSGIHVVAQRIKSVLDTYSLAELAGSNQQATLQEDNYAV
ncbi:MAG: Rrf2 family transcriptional regulator [Planctomycetota bacterium]